MLLRVLTVVVCAALGALVPLLLSLNTHAPSAPKVIRLRTEGRPNGWSAKLDARVNGRAIELGLDTGGDTSSLSPEFKELLRIAGESTSHDSNGLRKVYVSQPSALEIDGHALGAYAFRLNGEYIKLTHGRELWGTSVPVLGLDVLTQYRFHIDGPAGTLTLRDDSAPLEGTDWIPYRGFLGTPHIIVEATAPNGQSLLVFLDTGYERSRLCRAFSAPGATPLVLKIGSTVIRAAGIELLDGNHDLEYANTETGEKVVIHATLGWDVLRHCIQEISPRNRKLRLIRAGTGN